MPRAQRRRRSHSAAVDPVNDLRAHLQAIIAGEHPGPDRAPDAETLEVSELILACIQGGMPDDGSDGPRDLLPAPSALLPILP